MSNIVKFFYKLVKLGEMTIADVPGKLRAKVQAMLDADAAQNE